MIPEYISKEEHTTKYLVQEYLDNRTREFPSQMKENFLNQEEIDIINYYWLHPKRFHFLDTSMVPIQQRILDDPTIDRTAEYNVFSDLYTNPWWAGLKEMLYPKVRKWLGEDIWIPHCHVLDSRYPYGIHTDAQQAGFNNAQHPAWTIIVPLEDYNSKTYVFNEPSVYKQPDEHVENSSNLDWTEIEKQDMCVSEDIFVKDFEALGTQRRWLKLLTIDGTFPWKAGRAICSDRYKLHGSDNYYNYGITNKRALIMWTTHSG